MKNKDPKYKSMPINNNHARNKGAKKIYKKRVYYSFWTVILLICFIQTARGAYINVAKYITLNGKLHQLQVINTKTKKINQELKQELKDYNSSKGIEALARDNLKMAGKNEVLVIIKDPEKIIQK